MKPGRKSDEVRMTIPAEERFIPLATETARQYAGIIGFSEDNLYKIELAVEEAVQNVIHHGLAEPDDTPTFDISFSISEPYGICIRIGEKGIPFDPSKVSVYDPAQASMYFEMSGLGVQLIRGMMDTLEYRNLGLGGKETVLVKYLGTARQGKGAADKALPAAEEKKDGVSEPLPFNVRRLEPAEAIEVSRGAYRSHGYTFFNDVIYYPEKIREFNEKGLMISAVAVTRRQEFMGHGALLLSGPDARIGEINFVFVNRQYREQNCLSRITQFLFKTALEKNLVGICGYAVTAHVYSQKMGMKTGSQPVAILLATSPMSWEFKGIAGQLTQRISVVLLFVYIRAPQKRVLHAPDRHRERIRLMYANLKAGHTFEKTPVPPDSVREEASIIRTDVSEVENCAEIWIVRAGSKVAGDVRRTLRKLCVKGLAAISLFLSLEDGSAAVYADAFEKMGFFFAGILPETPIGDAMILQYLNNIEIDYSAVKVLPGETQTLLDYIRDCDPNREP